MKILAAENGKGFITNIDTKGSSAKTVPNIGIRFPKRMPNTQKILIPK